MVADFFEIQGLGLLSIEVTMFRSLKTGAVNFLSVGKWTNLLALKFVFGIFVFGIGLPANAGPLKGIKDWFVYCSDGLACRMSTNSIEGKIYSFEIARGTAANAPLKLSISFEGDFAPGSVIRLQVKKTGMDISVPARDAVKDDFQWVFDVEEHRAAFLASIKAGKRLAISIKTQKGDMVGSVSLSGVVASLLFIDEAQGRVDRTDALHAVGNAPAVAVVTRVVALKKQADLPKSVRLIWANEFARCSDDETDIIERFGGSRVDIDKETGLYLLPCNLPGAYNMPYVVIAHNVGSEIARRISFPIIGNRGPTNMDTAFNVEWNDKLSRLSAFYKGRGIGDCGSRHLWEWSGDSLYGEFELIEERSKEDCDEKMGDFPLIWPPD